MSSDLISDALSIINNAENVGKSFCVVPNSKLVKNVLEVMRKADYIGKIEYHDRDISVRLMGKINKTKSIRPRFSVKWDGYEKFEKRFLPAKDIGILIVSTSRGVMNQKEAKKKNLGGKLLAYIY